MRDEIQNSWYQNVQEELEQERICIHDVKQHFMILQAYEKREDWKSLRQYLQRIGGQIQEIDRMIFEDNAEAVPANTHTSRCMSFWTIYCC